MHSFQPSHCENPNLVETYAHGDCAAFADALMWHLDEHYPQLNKTLQFFFDSHARLTRVPISEIMKGDEDHNIPSKKKQTAYAKMPSGTRPPIVLGFNNEVVDGNHRYRDALARGETHILAYQAQEGRLESEKTMSDPLVMALEEKMKRLGM